MIRFGTNPIASSTADDPTVAGHIGRGTCHGTGLTAATDTPIGRAARGVVARDGGLAA